MNGPQTRAYTKDNAFTRLIDRVSMQNASEGKPAGRAAAQAAESFVTAIPASRVRSMNPREAARLDFVPPPMSPEEVMAANARAAALGVADDMDGPMMPGMLPGRGPTSDPGGPTEEELEAMLPARFRTGPAATSAAEHVANHPPFAGIPSGVPMQPMTGMPTARSMPNFRNIQGFNLEKGVAVVDGIEFPLAEEDVKDMKKFALHVVLDNMVVQVAQALVDIGVPQEMADKAAASLRETVANASVPGSMQNAGEQPAARAVEAVHDVPLVTAEVGVPSEPDESGRAGERVQDVPAEEGLDPDVEWLLREEIEDVSTDDTGSGSGSEIEPRIQLGDVAEAGEATAGP